MKYSFSFFSALVFTAGHSFAQLTPLVDSIPMRDGKKLAADIYIPSGCTQCPTVLVQTPYNRLWYHFGLPLGVKLNLNASNYNFVILDWRGFYGSNNAAYSGSPTRGQDGYDAVEWIAQQSWSNGKVATWGPSALGVVQFLTARENPSHLVCIVPQVAAPYTESYSSYFPGGVYRTEYVEQLDALGYGLSPILLANPVKNLVWTYVENKNNFADSIFVPAFMQGGWYDHTIEAMLPWFNAIRTQSPLNVRDKHRLLMGPWVHGGHGASYVGSATQGELSYPNAAGWSDSLAMLFLDYYVRGIANGWNNMPYVTYYQMGDNTWLNSPAWPPAGLTDYKLYFRAGGADLTLTAPTFSNPNYEVFSYDPLNPSPTIGGPTLRTDLDQGPYDQDSAVESRNDIRIYSSPVLTQDVVMKGSAKVHLTVSSDEKDTDFAIRLTDVYPDGRSMLVNDGIFRMRFRNGFTAADTAVMVPGTLYPCDITLPSTCLTFKAGHRIRVDVTSSNYPRFNRNANNGGVMYPGNKGDSLLNPNPASNMIFMESVNYNSYISLPLTASPVLAVNEFSENIHVEVFPNPASGKFTISTLEQVEAGVYNLTGEEILAPVPVTSEKIFDLGGQPKGVYFLRIKTGDGRTAVKKIVVI